MLVLIYTPELQMWQKSGSEHKPATVLGKAGSAGPEDLSVLTPGTGAGASMYTDICASTGSSSIADTAFHLIWPWKSEAMSPPCRKVACIEPKNVYAGLCSHTYQAI